LKVIIGFLIKQRVQANMTLSCHGFKHVRNLSASLRAIKCNGLCYCLVILFKATCKLGYLWQVNGVGYRGDSR